VEQSAGRCCWH